MTWQYLTLIGWLLVLVVYVMTLYHLAHGNERKAVELGARLVLQAMQADGRILDPTAPADPDAGKPFNIGEDDFVQDDESLSSAIPDVIVARSEQAAEQIGDRLMAIMAAEIEAHERATKKV